MATNSDEELERVKRELAMARERLESLVKTEERLRVSERRLRSYFAQTSDEVWCWDYEPPLPIDLPEDELARELPRRAVLVDCNDVAAEAAGVGRREDIIGKTYAAIFPDVDQVPLVLQPPGQSFAETEVRRTSPTGETTHFVIRRTHRIVDGCVEQTWATTREVTAARRAGLSMLARGIAHDFNTLLARMIGHVEIARVAVGTESGASLDAIRDSVVRALDLVEQIEKFSPMHAAVSELPPPPSNRPLPGKGARVLLVDDEPQLALLAEHALVDLGYRVTRYANPTAALATFRTEPSSFDVVVTDQSMPELQGIELASEISKIRSGIPILLMSGYAEIIPAASLRRAGIVASLPKPFPLEELGAHIRAALDARATASDRR